MDTPSRPTRRLLGAAVTALLSLTVAFTVTTVASASTTTPQAASTAQSASVRIAKPPKTTSAPSSATSASTSPAPTTPPTTCSDGASPVAYSGHWYCPGYVIGIKNTAYGIGTRIVVSGYVTQVVGTSVTVEGGPSCLPGTSTYCGATIPNATTSFGGLPTLPRYGDVITVSYDPDFG
jgi:hypothetical protein